MTSSSSFAPALPTTDEYGAADRARRRLQEKPKFHLFKQAARSSSATRTSVASSTLQIPEESLPATISLANTSVLALNEDEDKDTYEWAVVYENQRGITVFSIPYYSRLSLLPSDPYPFTIPSASHSRSHQPNVSLDQYPLPDGTWRWVSKSWMIDMRSDSGEVQHDGFEYNWVFQTKYWRPTVGRFNSGGWVRRRRWVRLMMRPGKRRKENEAAQDGDRTPVASHRLRQSLATSSLFPPSVLTQTARVPDDLYELDVDEVWLNDDAEENWARCKMALKPFARDGKKLEVWGRWLGVPDAPKRVLKRQWTEDDYPLPSESSVHVEPKPPLVVPPISRICEVIKQQGDDILQSFVYPESRARFISMLDAAKVGPELQGALRSTGNFYSLRQGIE